MLILLLAQIVARANINNERPAIMKRSIDRPILLALTAGDDGPFFSQHELDTYTPPPPKSLEVVRLKPTNRYPIPVSKAALSHRTYSTNTTVYLAEHEVRHGSQQSPIVALTFDCETGTYSALKILETLEREQVRATFFILGKYAHMFPDIVHQIAADGHEIGNHSFYHPPFTALSPISATQEIVYTEKAIEQATGKPIEMRYFRFPYGARNNETRIQVASLGYQSVFWDIDPRGWEPNNTSSDVVQHIENTAHRGGIVIMHCGSWNDANALADAIQSLRKLGLQPGPVTEVLTDQDKDIPNYP